MLFFSDGTISLLSAQVYYDWFVSAHVERMGSVWQIVSVCSTASPKWSLSDFTNQKKNAFRTVRCARCACAWTSTTRSPGWSRAMAGAIGRRSLSERCLYFIDFFGASTRFIIAAWRLWCRIKLFFITVRWSRTCAIKCPCSFPHCRRRRLRSVKGTHYSPSCSARLVRF